MRQLIISFFIVLSFNAKAGDGSGDQLAHPPTVIVAEIWHYNQSTPVYQVDLEHADSDSARLAVEAAIASVRPEFKSLTPALVNSLSNYIVREQHTGTHSRYYIHRSVVADWLIMS